MPRRLTKRTRAPRIAVTRIGEYLIQMPEDQYDQLIKHVVMQRDLRAVYAPAITEQLQRTTSLLSLFRGR